MLCTQFVYPCICCGCFFGQTRARVFLANLAQPEVVPHMGYKQLVVQLGPSITEMYVTVS